MLFPVSMDTDSKRDQGGARSATDCLPLGAMIASETAPLAGLLHRNDCHIEGSAGSTNRSTTGEILGVSAEGL
jgi:hypothetical protein